MKKLIKFTLIAAAMVVIGSSSAFAQKFGYINSGELIQAMPESNEVKTKLEALSKDHEAQYELMRKEYTDKATEYQKTIDTMSDVIRQTKEKELQSLISNIQEFEETAVRSLQYEQQKLMQPVVEKARAAIEKVAKAGNLTGVFDTSEGMLLYQSSDMVDLLPLVKTEMGI